MISMLVAIQLTGVTLVIIGVFLLLGLPAALILAGMALVALGR